MLTVLLGLGGALVYGAADFLGGLAARRVSAIRVTAIGGAAGVVLIAVLLPVVGGAWSPGAVALGALSGLAGAGAVALLYGCLAIGPMSILSPLTAVVSAIVPLTAGLIRGERLGPIGYVALGVALVAVVLVGFVPDRRAVRPSGRALAMAMGSGILIGVFLIIIDLTPDDSGLVPLLFNKAVNSVLLAVVVLVLAAGRGMPRRAAAVSTAGSSAVFVSTDGASAGADSAGTASVALGDHGAPLPEPAAAVTGGTRSGYLLAVACGVVDTTANVLLLLALRSGDLSIVSVLTAMYPAGTIVLAAIVLRERIAPTQYVGLGLAIAAAALLSLG